MNTDFNRARKRWWRVSREREREYILLINLTIHLDTHTHTEAAKAEENIKNRIFNLQFI